MDENAHPVENTSSCVKCHTRLGRESQHQTCFHSLQLGGGAGGARHASGNTGRERRCRRLCLWDVETTHPWFQDSKLAKAVRVCSHNNLRGKAQVIPSCWHLCLQLPSYGGGSRSGKQLLGACALSPQNQSLHREYQETTSF